ncbi:MAG TPA: asparagine synthase C-terminal domain-containing protein, partial [Longimicrobiales bacterium]
LYPLAVPVMKGMGHERLARQKLAKLTRLLDEGSGAAMYRSLLSAWQRPASALVAPESGIDPVEEALAESSELPLLDSMMLADQAYYLADDLLAKVDRASMAVSLEARVPLLDHRIVEFSWRLPQHLKVRRRTGKWLLREVLYRHVPRHMVERPKVGFTVPIDEWLRGPLRPWAEDLLSSVDAPLNRRVVNATWQSFQSGEQGLGLAMWAVVMFQAWRRAWSH